MQLMTFKQFVRKLDEDTQQDLDKLTTEIAAIEAQIAQRTTPLMQRKNQLEKLLYTKYQQKQIEDKRTPQTQVPGQPIQQPGQPQTQNTTTTPGAPGRGTPGAMNSSTAALR